MKIYCVGGAVRDELLGLPVQDRDWVVVGGTPEALIAQGFRPVGKDFPVFLHPVTNEEYALARTERKTGAGYKGFVFHYAPDVSLEDDLRRRDLTVNAIARAANGTLIDPLGGLADLHSRVLRHTGLAFAEDPVRILRLARFAARFADFSIAPETMSLLRAMVDSGEVDALVPERVWQEVARGMMETRPSRLFETLRECGALARLMPELDRLWGVAQRAEYHPEIDTGVHVMMVLEAAARAGVSLPVRFAALTHDLGKGTTPPDILPRHIGHEARSVGLVETLCARLRAPAEVRDLARIVAREHGLIHKCAELRPKTLLTLLERMDALRRPARLDAVLAACEADARGRLGFEDRHYPQSPRMRQALTAALSVDAGKIAASAAAQGLRGEAIGQRVHDARCRAIAQTLNEPDEPDEPDGH